MRVVNLTKFQPNPCGYILYFSFAKIIDFDVLSSISKVDCGS